MIDKDRLRLMGAKIPLCKGKAMHAGKESEAEDVVGQSREMGGQMRRK